MNTQHIKKWLALEEEWQEKEGLLPDNIWYPKMIEVYQNLIWLSPENHEYRTWLAKYLMEYATDLKLRFENYRRAKELFESVLELQPTSGITKYHLGYIYFIDEYWPEALTFLREALKTNELTKQQRIRGLLASALCLHKTHRFDVAEEMYQEAKALDTHLEHTTEFQLTKAQMVVFPEDEFKPYLLETKEQGILPLRDMEATDLLGSASKDHPVLNFTEPDCPRFLTGNSAVELQGKEGQLLRELLASSQVKSNHQLREAVWQGRGNPQIVKRYIGSLRKKLAVCFDEPITEIIKTIPEQGYLWNDSKPVFIISFNKSAL